MPRDIPARKALPYPHYITGKLDCNNRLYIPRDLIDLEDTQNNDIAIIRREESIFIEDSSQKRKGITVLVKCIKVELIFICKEQ